MARITPAAPSLNRWKAAASTSYPCQVSHKQQRSQDSAHVVSNEYVKSVEVYSKMRIVLLRHEMMRPVDGDTQEGAYIHLLFCRFFLEFVMVETRAITQRFSPCPPCGQLPLVHSVSGGGNAIECLAYSAEPPSAYDTVSLRGFFVFLPPLPSPGGFFSLPKLLGSEEARFFPHLFNFILDQLLPRRNVG